MVSLAMPLKWLLFLGCCYFDTCANKCCFFWKLQSSFRIFFIFCCQVFGDSFGHELSLWQMPLLFQAEVYLLRSITYWRGASHGRGSSLTILTLGNLYILSGKSNSRVSVDGLHNWMVHLRWGDIRTFFILVMWMNFCLGFRACFLFM